MKYLIAGLGNAEPKYDHTRHNIGFEVLDALAGASNISFEPDRLASVTEYRYKGRILVMIKPTTYMNLSGKAVAYWMQKEKIPLERVLVVTDDLALPFGKVRMRGKGSDGGHNGLKHIQATLNTTEYARIRFGIGSEYHRGHQIDYVLGTWSEEEADQLPDRLKLCCDMIKGFVTIGLNRTMSEFNNK
ncbi:MAG: aminoacyl-tRNA hydrolase [Flavobacteriales bacterium]|nr:aminoacyl-tRNA hydrolase [Flavobacteriales bacterium]